MKKSFRTGLILSTMTLLASCGVSSKTDTFTVGICNYVDDASLNQICENIQEVLKEEGMSGVKFDVKYQNCNADTAVLNQIISDFVSKDVDLMVGVATPVAMAMQAATEDNKIPVVFAAVSDPVGCGVVDSLAKPGANITGTSDYLDTNAVFNLMFALNENPAKVGLLYDLGQDSSKTPIADAKAILQKKGVEVVESTGTNTTEIIQAAQNLISKGVDAIFTPSDNTVMAAELSIYEMIADAKIPHYTGADSFALNGAFLGYGVDYANLGRETGAMVVDILKNKKDVSNYPVKTFDNGTATINTETCAKLGYNLDEVKTKFTPYCTSIKTLTTSESF